MIARAYLPPIRRMYSSWYFFEWASRLTLKSSSCLKSFSRPAEVFGTLLQAIKCPVSPSYDDPGCSLSTDPQLKGGVFDQGLNFSAANATQWNLCWQQGPDCSRGPRMNTGLVTTSKILPVLTQHGNAELALELVLSTVLPSWGYIIEQGGSTYWEVRRLCSACRVFGLAHHA